MSTETIDARPIDEDDKPFALQEPPIGKQEKKSNPTGKRTVAGVWAVYHDEDDKPVTHELYADEVDALRAVADAGGDIRRVFVPWGESVASMTAGK